MSPFARHVILPALAPAALLGLYFTPVSLIGCANRGWLALALCLLSAAAAFATVAVALRAQARHAPSGWWVVTTVILTVPLLLLLGPLG